jgi:hypothetical protein
MTEKGAEQTCDAKLVLLGNSGTRSHHCITQAVCWTRTREAKEKEKKGKK